MATRRLIVLAAAAGLAACSLGQQNAPGLTGPSELGLSLGVSVTPDVITQNGQSEATVEVTARDAASQPVRGLGLRVDMQVNGVSADFGTLSSRNISTGSDGRAVVTYYSPPPPPPNVTTEQLVRIVVRPVGANYANTLPRTVDLRLVPPGIILPPNAGPLPDFLFSPTTPKEEERVFFDASVSRDPDGQIVAYTWTFGDGGSATGVQPSHAYEVAGQYTVVLTVRDDRNATASVAKAITVAASANPVASFTFSPTGPKVGDTVFFNGSASTAPTGRAIVAYDWDMGDGTFKSGVTPSHVYTKAGTVTVTLTVTDSAGRKSVASRTLTIG